MLTDLDTLRLRFEASERESEHGFNLHKYGIGYADEATQARWEAWIACRDAMLQAGNHTEQHLDMVNSPVIPDGYVMVPKEPTAKMYDAGDQQMATKQVWDAMLAAAPQPQNSPQNIPEIIHEWIPVSERMPDDTVDADGGATCYLVFYAEGRQPNGGSDVQVSNVTYLRRWHEGMITHWMPLPAAPQQEVK
ncbi:TPA: DUF551 domain-containing protein [Citrobacter freundii]|nr:DUF551 domain-containing protein [Citrobacter freundii]